MDLAEFLRIARGDAAADLVLRNARVVNVYTGEIVPTDIAVAGDRIVGFGTDYDGADSLDVGGRYVCPGLIDAHVHIESSMVCPVQFARAVLARGTTTVVADPHEIANVAGAAGVRYMLAASEGIPLEVLVSLPSCVPATNLATAGAELGVDELRTLAELPRVIGLGEFMNVPGAVLGMPGVLEKLESFQGRVIDGHAPGVTGKWLQAYVGAGPGSDHECTEVEEMLEKLRAGMYVFLREATGAKNVRTLVPAVTPLNARRCAFSTDDRHPAELIDEGHIDHIVRIAVSEGLDPITAIQMATLNAAEWFRLHDRGAISPGNRADLVVFSNLKDFHAEMVLAGGRLVASEGTLVAGMEVPQVDAAAVRGSVHVDLDDIDFTIKAPYDDAHTVKVRVIGVVPDQLLTNHLLLDVPVRGGLAVPDLSEDVLKICVIERHRGTGNVGVGFVQGLGLRAGAMASSVGHDAHNLIVAGCDDVSMAAAARAVADSGGGMAVANGTDVLASLALPIAGLMSEEPLERVREAMDRMVACTRELGSPLRDPFMTLGFLALEVIPSLKLTDRGLVDVEQFDYVPLWVS
jgi:adenine deaminase